MNKTIFYVIDVAAFSVCNVVGRKNTGILESCFLRIPISLNNRSDQNSISTGSHHLLHMCLWTSLVSTDRLSL